MPYSHVLLDLDHTLLDTDASMELAFVDAMERVSADATGRYPIFDTINRRMWKQVEAGELTPQQVHVARFVELDAQLELGADIGAMADAFAFGLGRHGELYEGARSMLEALAEQAVLAMITNGLSDIQRARIERLDLGRYFAAITISAEVGCAKPGTEIFDLTLSQIGSPDQSTALMVGDNIGSDILGGYRAGVDTCWYNPDGNATDRVVPTHTVATLAQVVAIVSG